MDHFPAGLGKTVCNLRERFGQIHPYYLVAMYAFHWGFEACPEEKIKRLGAITSLCQEVFARDAALSIECLMSPAHLVKR